MSAATKTQGEWTGRQVVDTSGAKVGTVFDVYYGEAIERPEWMVVKTGLFGTKKVFVPTRDVRVEGDKLRIPYTQERAKESPSVARDEAMSHAEERELYLYYGIDHPEPTPTEDESGPGI